MDWIEEVFEKWKNRISRSSLRKVLILYIIVALVCVICLIIGTSNVCKDWKRLVSQKYYQANETMYSATDPYYYTHFEKITDQDKIILQITDFFETWSAFFYTIVAIVLTSTLFYKNRIEVPLSILINESKHIAKNELNFVCTYKSQDEMGELCSAFDKMRQQLIENNEKMWSIMEEQSRINAAFAHDLRTPLTVLHGYTDLLLKYYPEGKISDEKLLDTLKLMDGQVTRLEEFGNTMKEINRLDQLEINKKPVSTMELQEKINNMIYVLNGTNGIHIILNDIAENKEKVNLDERVVLEVVENLISNALRYAKSEIQISLDKTQDGKELILYIKDDGKGFSRQELKVAVKPYYRDQSNNSTEHFGIGLTICKLLCEKHGGFLRLANSIKGGAIVTVSFYIM